MGQKGSISVILAFFTSSVVVFGVIVVFYMAALRKNVVDQGKLDVCLAEKGLVFRDLIEVIETTNTIISCARTAANGAALLLLPSLGASENVRSSAVKVTKIAAGSQELVKAYWTLQQARWLWDIVKQKSCGLKNTIAFPLPSLPFEARESACPVSGEHPLDITSDGSEGSEFLLRAYM
ncbi:MAG: hypothetical protein AAB425_04175, partial [Bdellovibrionota bacterium]